MDLEVTKAFRTLERVGMSGPTPLMDPKEFKSQYGKLIHNWLKEHNYLVRVYKSCDLKIKNGYGSYSFTQVIKIITTELNKEGDSTYKVNITNEFPSFPLENISFNEKSDENNYIISEYLGNILLEKLVAMESEKPNSCELCLFLLGGEPIRLHGNTKPFYEFKAFLCFLEPETTEEKTEREAQELARLARNEAQKQKRREAAERTRATKERKERETLRKLTEKYGKPEDS